MWKSMYRGFREAKACGIKCAVHVDPWVSSKPSSAIVRISLILLHPWLIYMSCNAWITEGVLVQLLVWHVGKFSVILLTNSSSNQCQRENWSFPNRCFPALRKHGRTSSCSHMVELYINLSRWTFPVRFLANVAELSVLYNFLLLTFVVYSWR